MRYFGQRNMVKWLLIILHPAELGSKADRLVRMRQLSAFTARTKNSGHSDIRVPAIGLDDQDQRVAAMDLVFVGTASPLMTLSWLCLLI